MTIPEWLAIGAFGIIVAVVAWGIKRLISAQDALYEKFMEMALNVTKLCGDVENAMNLQSEHKKLCDSRHIENTLSLQQIMQKVGHLPRNGGRS